MGGEEDGRSDDSKVVGTSTRLCLRVAHEPCMASESNVGMNHKRHNEDHKKAQEDVTRMCFLVLARF